MRMSAELYDALMSAGADDDKARAAAAAVESSNDGLAKLEHRFDLLENQVKAGFEHSEKLVESKFRTLQWMLGTLIGISAAAFMFYLRSQ